ncbi:MAG: Diacylglycerol kinase [uncultured bacterium]|nr:MAG: Diacylglycerol kinase [uncultured bacterium]
MKEEMRRFKRSLKHAFDGIKYAVVHEKNFRLEILAALVVIAFIFLFDVKSWEAIILLLMIMWVFISELTNTVLERVVDILKPRIHPYARLIKDLMAAVVLISATGAAVVGVIIFYPYLRDLVVFLCFF